jgi:thiol-disulfide isomerase/thioredoxin
MLQFFCRRSSAYSLTLSFFTVAFLTVFWVGCKKAESEKSSGAAQSQEKEAQSAKSTTDSGKKADTGRSILESMARAYRSAKSYSDKATVRLHADVGSKPIDRTADFSVAYEQPNKLRMEAYSAKLVIDGDKVYASIADLPGQVLEKSAPATLTRKTVYSDRLLAAASCNDFAGAAPQLLLLLDDKAIDILLHDAEEPKLGEPGEIDGRSYHRVQVRMFNDLAVFWVDKETLVLRRMILPTNAIRNEIMTETGSQVDSLSIVADFTGAQLNGPIDATAFQFAVPSDAEVVKYFIPPDPGQLLAKKVPNFKFFDLSGKAINAGSLAGKIVVLDFWATWCEPCKVSLPNMQKVYEKYKDNDKVAFLAVSVDEPQVDNNAVDDVFRDLKVKIPVGRDPNNSAAAFKFNGIPCTFIIDANGMVQDYESGENPNLVTVLSEKLDKLLNGENIFDAPLKRYQDNLKEYEKATAGSQEESGAKVEELAIPQAKIAERSESRNLKLSPLWKCTDLKSPGNILTLTLPNSSQRMIVIENAKSLVEVGPDGKVIASHKLDIGDAEFITNIRAITAANGKRYIAVFAGFQQRCHLLDDKWKIVLSYPDDVVEHPHSGIADVELYDLDNDGVPNMYVSYLGFVGVQSVSLEGKRVWSNRTLSNVIRMAATGANAEGRRDLICNNNDGTLVELDAKGQRQAVITVPNRMIGWIAGADLQGNGQQLWCGLSAQKMGETVALGFNLKGDELWTYTMPVGVQPQPIEQIIPGKITRDGPGQWLLPGPDGSINIISAEGKLIDAFNYGAMLQGLATISIDGQPVLVIASPKGLEAWKVE